MDPNMLESGLRMNNMAKEAKPGLVNKELNIMVTIAWAENTELGNSCMRTAQLIKENFKIIMYINI